MATQGEAACRARRRLASQAEHAEASTAAEPPAGTRPVVLMLLPGCCLACRVMPQYLQKGPDGRAPMDSVLNFPMYYKLTDVFASQQDMRM